ncbi:hypothetical protein D187_003353 [Cystobacter fuscus DSM 2262]|uniref:DUF2254 domain-containing protein n=1 Tax=Cystobacter fuscus (strain ATCC 25194 / DSM 2262 / NBRC 100088 / M29) TaxID=1242864 RepID=S9P725_CYSF2|nr:DUF2254 domain-containing protein [Cystobacter fuscus]EPX58976.1 hypothetical protein D187_003353 [Cystobacter fuscus DSM 2262]
MKLRLTRLAERLGTSYWLVPSLCVAVAIGLSHAAQALDAHLPQERHAWYLFRGGPEGARAVLSAVSSSMMTFAGLVFSVTILVLQQASNQFSPRVLRTFLRDRKSQLALGIFVGTFVYALLALRTVRGTSEGIERHVPSLSVWLAVVLALLCVGTFIFYIHHVAQSIRAVVILTRIRDETRCTLERMYPEGVGEDAREAPPRRPEGLPSLLVTYPGTSGVLVTVDEEQLFSCARKAGVTLVLVPLVGDFIPHGGLLFEVWGEASRLEVETLLGSLSIGPERTLQQDTAFGFRQLVDIAERALSPGINDPTTAVQAIDQLHDLLRRMVGRRFPSSAREDGEGLLRLVCPRPDWNAYVRLAVDEVRGYGEGSFQVAQRLRFLLEDLLRVAPAFRRDELERQLSLLEASVERAFKDGREAAMAHRANPQGHGPH